MISTTINLTAETELASEPMALRYTGTQAIGLVHVRDTVGRAVVMGSPEELRALAAAASTAAEQAEEQHRVAELSDDAHWIERAAG